MKDERGYSPRRGVSILYGGLGLRFILLVLVIGCFPRRPGFSPVRGGPVGGVGHYRELDVGDFDGDGNPDIAAGSTLPGGIFLWMADGAGGWRRWGPLTAMGEVHGLAVGDLDGDGLDDVVASAWGAVEGEGIWVWLNGGYGTWTPVDKPTDFGRYENIRLADIDLDGNVDIVAANATSEEEGGVQVWLGDGAGRWTVQVGPFYTGVFRDVAVADFNRDGNPDIAASGWGPGLGVRVWLGDGRGGWTSGIDPTRDGRYWGIVAEDFNGDGNPDIAVGSYLRGVRVWLGDGKGGWRRGKSPTQDGSFWRIVAPDIDGDGSPDLLAGSLDGEGIRFWLNDGHGGWKEVRGKFPSHGTYYGIVPSDLNGDGRVDLAAISYEEGVKVWFILGTRRPEKAAEGSARRPVFSWRPRTEVMGNKVYTEVSGIPEYLVGPRDVLEIVLWEGATERRSTVTVQDDGTISYWFLEDIKVDGLTIRQVDSLLTERLQEFVQFPRINVTVKEYRSKKVLLLGAVNVKMGAGGPGVYFLKGKTTLLDLLMKVGGPAPNADLENVRVTRGNRSFRVNLYDAMFKGDMSQNIVLDAGDRIVVPELPEAGQGIYVFGEVRSPGLYPFTRDMDLLTALSKAGGYTDNAALKSVVIFRGDLSRPRAVTVNVDRLLKEGDLGQNLPLRRGDIVFVPRTFVGDMNMFFSKMRTLSDFLFYPLDLYIRGRTLYIIAGGG
ncbi:MAG TPA: hypothetical protein EYP17_05705 [Candidatus Latescibacteria bacterium]|nr:hypothetical protein [Candidatus Latescibacterota bacterium]